MDSRDNPFLPGGSLRQEADEILSKATIVRDKFILEAENSRRAKLEASSPEAASPKNNSSPRRGDSHKNGNSCVSQSPVQETMTVNEVSKTENAVLNHSSTPSPTKDRVKENGQLDSDKTVTPGSVALEIADDDKDKKKQKKCCVVM